MARSCSPVPACWLAFGLVSAIAVAPSQGRAAPADGDVRLAASLERPRQASKDGLLVEVDTRLPLSIGGRVQVRLPAGLHVGAGIGLVPSPYLDATVAAARGIAGLDRATGDLVSTGFDRGLVADGFVGWRPWADEALYLQVGYAFVDLGGRLEGADVAALDVDLPDDVLGGAALEANAQLHAVEAEVGLRFRIEGLRVRVSLGLLAAFAAESAVRLDVPGFEDAAEVVASELEDEARRRLLAAAVVPNLGLGLGYDIGL